MKRQNENVQKPSFDKLWPTVLCVKGETAEDINCPIRGEFPLGICPGKRRGGQTRGGEGKGETAGLALAPCCSSA